VASAVICGTSFVRRIATLYRFVATLYKYHWLVEEPSTRTELPIWARPAKERRASLSRPAVVDAALRIADAEGLAAVSIRRVATDLGARAMTLYSHIDSKDDLLDLMREQVAGETIIDGELPADWREATILIARRERQTALRHPWLIQLIGHPGHIGPNALRHLEQSLRALMGLAADRRTAFRIAATIDEYVMGHVIREVTRHPTAVAHPYTRQLLAGGEFPTLGPLIQRGLPSLSDNFDRGLNWLLDGIEAAHLPKGS
jgi:AcrR family transcriptional regulator